MNRWFELCTGISFMRIALPVIILFTTGLQALSITDADWSALNDYGYSGAN